jgi:hypothetical protein
VIAIYSIRILALEVKNWPPGPSEGDTPSDMDWAIHNVLTILELVIIFFLISIDIHKVLILPFFIATIEYSAGFTLLLLLLLYQAF